MTQPSLSLPESGSSLIQVSSNLDSSGVTSGMVEVDAAEILRLSAADSGFYDQYFFPKTCRQASPPFHLEMAYDITAPNSPYVSFEVFRGGAKTTRFRLAASKSLALGFSRTILFVSKAQSHAIASVEWLMKAVQFNEKWASFFQLRMGKKTAADHIEILHGVEGIPIRVLAFGIEGSLRGVNIDDYRPDLIFVDDICDDENTATPEQRNKTSNLFFGAIARSLAPESEAPMRKLAIAQTPMNPDDIISQCRKDPTFKHSIFSCFNSNGESAWPGRWSTAELLKEKQNYIDKGKLSIWLREMECKLVSSETAAFPWSLRYWDVLPDGGITILSIDPTPPPKQGVNVNSASLQKLDDCALVVLRLFRGSLYLCDSYVTKSPDTEEVIAKFFEFLFRWNPMHVAIETVLFARTLARVLKAEMLRRRKYAVIREIEDRRKKTLRIRHEIARFAGNQKLLVHPSQAEFVQQYTTYPDVNHDDVLDAVSLGIQSLDPWMLLEGEGEILEGQFSVVQPEAQKQLAWGRAP